MWENNKIWINDYVEILFDQYLATMSPEEKAKYDAYPGLIQEFEQLHLQRRFRKAFEWKMDTITMEELAEWEREAAKM